MSKDNRDSQLSAGDKLLAEWGVAVDAGVGDLLAHAGRATAADLAIAARLGALAEPASVQALVEIEKRSSDKLVHKEVKRALYRLEQRGLVRPQTAAEAPAALSLTPNLEGYMSSIDGRGDQLVWILKPRAAGLLHLFAVLNDPDGMREIELADTTRKALRHARDELLQRHEIRMIDVDWRYADFLMDRGFRWASEKGSSIHGDYRALRAQITTQPVEPMPALIFKHLDAESVRAEASALRDSEKLIEQPELRTWFFTPEDLASYLKELQDMKNSPLVLSEAQQKERFREVIERAVDEVFGGERQPSWVRRLEDMAYFFHATNRAPAAKSSLAAALALKDSENGGRGIPVCELLVRSSLAAYWQVEEEREQEEAKGSLVLTPAQIARQTQRRR